MFTRFQRFYNSIKLVTDLVALVIAFAAAWYTRFTWFPFEGLPPTEETLETIGLILVIFPLMFRGSNLYTTNRGRTHISEVFEVFKATVLATLVLVGVSYFIRERYSRLTVVLFAAYAFLAVSSVRLGFRTIFNELRRRGVNLKTILVVGAGTLGQRVVETIEQHRELGFTVTGLLTRKPEKVGSRILNVPVVGLFSDLAKVLDEKPVDQVILALPLEEQPQMRELMEVLALRTIDVKVVPDLFSYVTLRGGLEEFGGLPIISLQGAPMEGWNRIAKRVFDILVSSLALLFLAPWMAVLAILVKLTSRGPVLFAQERMGIDGQLFHMYKFRTMKVDAEKDGAQFATAGDTRRTPIGAFLRRSSLDEVPQFWNVFAGDMSLVGPRPERPVFIEEFKKQIPRYHLRHMVKSGITGWAQINGLRGNTSIKDRIDYDLYYIENWSLMFDLKILVRTALGGFLSKNAY
ncbi:MAG: undecaprenyl-phosphate glucose phosphotransferase [Archangium sp.]|nr:undecaprenyl-phosphate glucose phosphotransferase [Archangium sp.]MDP3152579.1 undecaprenyl-phosphate glucose phosphotransferase [Archangium sp.]MDP3570999.1 undecaprenyl-phosphate glucose phosphotransferase [Archangium sp.]